MSALKRNVHDVWCTCSFKSAGWLGRCASSLRSWPRVAHQPKQHWNLRQVRGSIFSLLLVWFAGDMKSERPSKDDEQHCRCVFREEKTVLQSLDVAFSAPSRKSSRPSFLRRRTSTGFASREILVLAERESERFSPWQSENYHLWRDFRATECPTDKNGESRGMRLCHVFEDRPRIACVHACVPSYLVGNCCTLLTKHLLWHCICSIFLFVVCKSTL